MNKLFAILSFVLLSSSLPAFGQADSFLVSFLSTETAKTAFPAYYAFDNEPHARALKESKKEFTRQYDSISKEIAKRSKEPTLYVQRGIIKENLGMYAAAKEDYDHAFQMGYRKREMFLQLGKINYILGNRTNAITYFNSMLKKDSTDAEAYLYRGLTILYNPSSRINSLKQRGEESLPDFTKAINNQPDYTPALIFKGYAEYILSFYDMAISDLTKATKLSPKNEIALLLLGKAHLDKEEFNEACETFGRSVDSGFEVPERLLRKACGTN